VESILKCLRLLNGYPLGNSELQVKIGKDTEEYLKKWRERKKIEWINSMTMQGIQVNLDEIKKKEENGEPLEWELKLVSNDQEILKTINEVVSQRQAIDSSGKPISIEKDLFFKNLNDIANSNILENSREKERKRKKEEKKKKFEKLFQDFEKNWLKHESNREKERIKALKEKENWPKKRQKMIEKDLEYDSDQEKKYNEAIRVAKQYGSRGSEIIPAIKWAKELGGIMGIQKLQRLGLLEEALTYCCDNSMIEMGELILENGKGLKEGIIKEGHRNLAISLENLREYSKAEEHYILSGHPEDAIQMYKHLQMWTEAQRIGAKYGISINKNYEEFNSGNNNNNKGFGGEINKNNGIKKNKGTIEDAMKFEKSRNFDEAINTYLGLTPEEVGGEEQYDQVLERAVKLTFTFRNDRLSEVVNQVAELLISMNRHLSLGKILESINAVQDAFEIYKTGGLWEEALRLVQYLEPEEQEEFQIEYKEHLAGEKNVDKLISNGNIDSGLQILAERNEWEECLQLAQKEGEQYIEKYTMLYAQQLINSNNNEEAIKILARYSPSVKSQNIPSYIEICKKTLYSIETFDPLNNVFYELRRMLFKILIQMPKQTTQFRELESITRGIHLICQQHKLEELGLIELSGRASIGVLRYSNILPADYLFYKAGEMMEKLGKESAAMVFYNRLIDIKDTIESGISSGGIDNKNFEMTDIPKELCLRKQLSISEEKAERIKDWTLEKSLSSDIDAQIPMAPCTKCGKLIYEASLSCRYCRTQFEFCHITGYPVINLTRCSACGCSANIADWTTYIAKTGRCPCCDSVQAAGA